MRHGMKDVNRYSAHWGTGRLDRRMVNRHWASAQGMTAPLYVNVDDRAIVGFWGVHGSKPGPERPHYKCYVVRVVANALFREADVARGIRPRTVASMRGAK